MTEHAKNVHALTRALFSADAACVGKAAYRYAEVLFQLQQASRPLQMCVAPLPARFTRSHLTESAFHPFQDTLAPLQ